MNNKKFYILRLILMVGDLVILNMSYGSAWLLFIASFGKKLVHINLLSLAQFNAAWLLFAAVTRLYKYQTLLHIETIYRSTWRTLAGQAGLYVAVYYLMHQLQFQYAFISFCYGLLAGLLLLNRFLLTYITEFIFKKVVARRKVLIVGDNHHGRQLANYFNQNASFYSLAGIFSSYSGQEQPGGYYEVNSANCIEFAARHQVNDIYATMLPHEDKRMQYLRDAAENKGMRVLFVPGRHQPFNATYHRIDFIDTMPVLSLRAEPLLRQKNALRKRIFDVAFSALVIVLVMSWLTPVIALLIKLSSRGPVFFVQQRSGKDNHSFPCFKFRSMRVNQGSNTRQATKDDNRITRIGAFMRKTSIDELPQFFNVLIGTMSIVGPRPHMLKHTEEYSAIIDKYMVRHYLKPGITGWAQVNGYRGETSDVSLMEKRVAYDIEYMESWSLMQDVKIVFMTIINIFRGEEMAR